MGFFDELGKKISGASQSVAQRASDLADITGLQMNLSGKERDLAVCYRTLGEQYYRECKATAAESLRPAVEAVSVKLCEIDELQKQLRKLKRQKICADCGTINEMEDLYCGKCGAKLPEPEPEPAPEPEPEPVNAAEPEAPVSDCAPVAAEDTPEPEA